MLLYSSVKYLVAMCFGKFEKRACWIKKWNHGTEQRRHSLAFEHLQQAMAVIDGSPDRFFVLFRHTDKVPDVDAVNARIERFSDPRLHLFRRIDAAPRQRGHFHVVAFRR